jgi:hypothetical protein
MRQKMKLMMGILFSFVMVLGVMPGTSLTTLARSGALYADLVNTTTVVRFDDKDWYLVEDNSTADDAGTVTLLSKECVDASMFDLNAGSNTYSGSLVEKAVNTYYTNSISDDAKTAVFSNGLFLLTSSQARAITNTKVRKCSQYSGTSFNAWWLSSPGRQDNLAAFVMGNNGNVDLVGHVGYTFGVRPALKLNLESVIFSPTSKTFSVCQTISADDVTVTCSDTGKGVNANVTIPKTGGGAISYAVKPGSEKYISVNTTTGVVTIRKVPEEGKAYVIVTAAAVNNYAQATKEVTITIAHNGLVKTEEKAATEDAKGNKEYWTCSGCGKYFSDEEGKNEVQEGWWETEKLAHTHKLVKTTAKEATEDAEGNKEYWTCSGCGKYFSDEEGKNEVEEGWWETEKLAHTHKLFKTAAKEATEDAEGNKEYWTCSGCGKYFSDEEGKNEVQEGWWETEKLAHTHKLVKTDAKAATEDAEGNKEYWTCSGCGKYFSDEEGKNEVQEGWWETEKLDHTHKPAKTDATASAEIAAGNIEDSFCSKCGEYYSDVEGTKEIAEDPWIIEPGGLTSVVTKPAHTHKLKKTAAKEPKGTANGNTAYWYCSGCKKYFSDKNGKREIEKNSWVILARNKTFTHSGTKGKYKVTSKGSKNPTVTYIGCTDSKATSITIPATVRYGAITYKVTEVGKAALKGIKKVKKITVGENVKKIGAKAFSGCTKATKISLGKNVTTIGEMAFSNCSSLTKLTLPEKTTTLGKKFISKCNKKMKLSVKSKKMTTKTVKNGAFTGMTNKSGVTIIVPKGNKTGYQSIFRKKGLGKKVTFKENQ